jgi:hypothetical protein
VQEQVAGKRLWTHATSGNDEAALGLRGDGS